MPSTIIVVYVIFIYGLGPRGFSLLNTMLNISDDYKTLQNNVNCDLISLHEWLLANKISLNKGKTELIYFHKARSKVPNDLKIKMNWKRLGHSNKIKYLRYSHR